MPSNHGADSARRPSARPARRSANSTNLWPRAGLRIARTGRGRLKQPEPQQVPPRTDRRRRVSQVLALSVPLGGRSRPTVCYPVSHRFLPSFAVHRISSPLDEYAVAPGSDFRVILPTRRPTDGDLPRRAPIRRLSGWCFWHGRPSPNRDGLSGGDQPRRNRSSRLRKAPHQQALRISVDVSRRARTDPGLRRRYMEERR